jgi:ribosomal protein L23
MNSKIKLNNIFKGLLESDKSSNRIKNFSQYSIKINQICSKREVLNSLRILYPNLKIIKINILNRYKRYKKYSSHKKRNTGKKAKKIIKKHKYAIVKIYDKKKQFKF